MTAAEARFTRKRYAMMKAKIGGVELHYEVTGDGEPVVFVHGFPLSGRLWDETARALSAEYRCIVPDLRGHGESDQPHSSYSNREFNDDLIVLCEALGLRKPVAMGHSFGGSTLLHLTEHHPDFLGGLVILDSGIRTLASKVGELGVVSELTQAQRRQFLGDRLGGRIRRADPDTVKAATGQTIGGVAPVGHPAPLRTVVDVALAGYPEVWAAAGHAHTVFPTTFDELVRITGGEPGPVEPGETSA